MIFATERMEIKELSLKDIDNFHRIHGNKEIMEKIPAPVLTLEESKTALVAITEAYEIDDHRLRVWGAYVKDSERFIGICAAISFSHQSRDIGYRIVREYWGQGFATELTEGLINYLKLDSSIRVITACADKNNRASIAILEKYLTFVKEEYNAATNNYEYHYRLLLQR